jgi:hypothetical protein
MAASKSPAKAEPAFDPRVGEVRLAPDFFRTASLMGAAAHRMVPLLSRWVLLMAMISGIAMGVSVLSVWVRPNPQVLLSYPDGTTRCAMPPLDPETGRPRARPANEEEVCGELAAINEEVR